MPSPEPPDPRTMFSLSLKSFSRIFLVSLGSVLFGVVAGVHAQENSVLPTGLPYINTGPDSAFAQADFAQMYLEEQKKRDKEMEENRIRNKKLVDSGVISALDLAAPGKAVEQFNHATSLLKAQDSREAAKSLEKALRIYPKFVSAHVALGLAYLDQSDPRAKDEFEEAAKLDGKFPAAFLNLGLLALSEKDYRSAATNLEKAAAVSPSNPKVLSALAFAENGDREYAQTLKTVERVHGLDHHGMANVHYIAAAAAIALTDPDTTTRELELFLTEDPTNPLAPTARRNLEILKQRKNATIVFASPAGSGAAVTESHPQTFPNSDRLKQELNEVGNDSVTSCDACNVPAGGALKAESSAPPEPPGTSASAARSSAVWTIRKTVDETALFFAVSHRGHMVNNLELANVQILDNDKPPQRILQFLPQSKLPLRLGLLIDTSGSVQKRFPFEKRAATQFLEKVLNGTSDLGFVAGFNSETTVSQDFTAAQTELAKGIEQLKNAGGTALFDAVSLACWKLAAYPEQERVAKVLVILSDGEDNSSHRSLKQSVEDAETSGVTIYIVSTKEAEGTKTDADKILEVLAERSGGEAMFPGDSSVLGRALDKLRDLIRSRYLVAYKPADFEPNGKYHAIHVMAEKNGKRLQVHARKGYYARLEPTHN